MIDRGVYYNDNDPFVCEWLRNLIRAGHLPAGDVDERPIETVEPGDVKAYRQCHFFAGIGGWPLALKLAGFDGPAWTGSCPCQPFSVIGEHGSVADPRHLWPHWFRLIRECRPDVVFGEQVANAVGHGWLDLLSSDMEGEGYAVGAAVLGAHSVGAAHIRQRLYFVADAERERLEGHAGDGNDGDKPRWISPTASRPVAPSGELVWSWARGRDGKYRPIESGTLPMAHGVPARVGRLRAYGNSLVPNLAAAFVAAYILEERK